MPFFRPFHVVLYSNRWNTVKTKIHLVSKVENGKEYVRILDGPFVFHKMPPPQKKNNNGPSDSLQPVCFGLWTNCEYAKSK